MKVRTLGMLAAALCFGTTACGDDDPEHEDDGHSHAGEHADAGEPDAEDGIEIAGDWTGEFGEEVVSDDDWNGSAIISFDNEENVAITQNADDAEFDPGLFNKNVWTEPNDDGFYYCTVDFGLETAAEAEESTETADADDLEEGCGGFPWTQLMAQ